MKEYTDKQIEIAAQLARGAVVSDPSYESPTRPAFWNTLDGASKIVFAAAAQACLERCSDAELTALMGFVEVTRPEHIALFRTVVNSISDIAI